MKTDEIIKALECCKDRRCDVCDRRYGHRMDESFCRLDLMEHALHLIGVQKAELEKQAVNVSALEAGIKREKERADALCRWIPVTERLPDVPGYVLVWDSLPKYAKILWYHEFEGYSFDDEHPKKYFGNASNQRRYTHWMPLPDAPKEEEE